MEDLSHFGFVYMVMEMPVSMPVLPARGGPLKGARSGVGRERVSGRRERRRERECMADGWEGLGELGMVVVMWCDLLKWGETGEWEGLEGGQLV